MSEMRIALLGQPNSGKSTLFNGLTGSHQHVGNWPGKTVEQKMGTFVYNGKTYEVVDLPGTYSLAANSDEEIVTRDYIESGKADLICILADASQLERSLFMLADYVGIRVPSIVLLNMMDVAKDQGKVIDPKGISERLGIPVIPFVASDIKKYQPFYDVISAQSKTYILNNDALLENYKAEFPEAWKAMETAMQGKENPVYETGWLFAKLLEGDEVAKGIVKKSLDDEAYETLMGVLSKEENGASRTGNCKFQWIESLLKDNVKEQTQTVTRNKFDRIATSRVWGKWVAAAIILLSLVLSIVVGLPLMGIGSAFAYLGAPIRTVLTNMGVHPFLISLIAEALLTAFSFSFMMCGYIFGATLVFGFLEDIGYMARISYVFDSTMQKLGLHGKAVMPFLVSFGCNIAGSSGSRILDSWGQRMTAIAMSWVVPCGSTWGVVGLIATVFFGPLGAALIVFLLFVVSVLHLQLTAHVYGKRFLNDADRTGLIMELPPYHKPKWGSLFRLAYVRMIEAFKRAIGIISLVAIVLCILSYSKEGSLDHSVLYRIGSAIEPVTMFFGLRWQTFMAWLASAMGKEGSLGVLASVFSNRSIMSTVANMSIEAADTGSIATNLVTALTKPEALAFIFAFYFNMPCVMSLVAAIHETHSVKWMLRIAVYYIGVSLGIAAIVYHVALLIF